MNDLEKAICNLSLDEKVSYVLPEYPTGYASTHLVLEGYEIDELIHIFNTYLKKFKIQFINHPYRVFWNIHISNPTNIDFPYGIFLIKLYKCKKDHIVDIYRLFSTDEMFETFYEELQGLFK